MAGAFRWLVIVRGMGEGVGGFRPGATAIQSSMTNRSVSRSRDLRSSVLYKALSTDEYLQDRTPKFECWQFSKNGLDLEAEPQYCGAAKRVDLRVVFPTSFSTRSATL
jgi:hypothetical protein